MIGQTVGSYVVQAQLGAGGMGAVYRARHAMLGREAAIKVLLPHFSANGDIVQRFFNEARAATSIRHPGIVEIYDFGVMADGVAFIAMEMLRGESLKTRLERGRPSVVSSLAIIRQMCGALGAAHAAGIVHRDLKPDNVFIVPDPDIAGGERIKLLDFGIAKLNHEGVQQHATRTGALMGTPAYMAPEQCRGVKVDHRADLYSLGCMLYEMLCGRPPFVGEGAGDVLGAHIYRAQAPVIELVPEVPADVSALIDRLLHKDPAQRPQTAAELAHQLDVVTPGGPRGSVPPLSTSPHLMASAPTTLSGAASSRTLAPRRGARFAAIGLVLAAAAVAALLFARRDGDSSAGPAASPPLDAAPAPMIDAGVDAAPVDAMPIDAPPAVDARIDAPPARRPIREPRVERKQPIESRKVVGDDDAVNPFAD